MDNLRATEILDGRTGYPIDYIDSAPAPVLYTRYANHGPATPAPYDAPPLSAYDPFTPKHFLPPYEYSPDPEGYAGLQGKAIPQHDPQGGWATRPTRATRPTPGELEPPHQAPADMVIPGVQHPDGRFEPHPYFAQRSAPGPPSEPEFPEEPSKHTVEVAVPVCCEACKERITNYVGQTPGVDAVECDLDEQKVTVTGDLPPANVLQRCRKCFRKATLV